MNKFSDRDRALEQPVWAGESGVSRSDYLARLGLRAALASRNEPRPERRSHARGVYPTAILLCSICVIGILLLALLPAMTSACPLRICHWPLVEHIGIQR